MKHESGSDVTSVAEAVAQGKWNSGGLLLTADWMVAWTIFPVQDHLWRELNVRLGLSCSASWWTLACFETKRGLSWTPWNDGQNVCRHWHSPY